MEIILSQQLYDQIKLEIKRQIQKAASFSDSTGNIEITDLAVNFEAAFQSVLLAVSPEGSENAKDNKPWKNAS